MGAPTITDWMQGGGTLLALALSAASLAWQGATAARRRSRRISAKAVRASSLYWVVQVEVAELDARARWMLRASVRSKGAHVFDLRPIKLNVPDDGFQSGQPTYDFGSLHPLELTDRVMAAIELNDATKTGAACFGVAVRPGHYGTVNLRLEASAGTERISRRIAVEPFE